MTKAPKKPKAKPVKRERIKKAELFAYAYVRNMGNGAAAAREVFGYTDTAAAAAQASRMLINANVQRIICEFLDAQRESLKKFSEQGNYYLTLVSQRLIEIISSKETSIRDCFEAMEKLMRLGGFELSENVAMAKIHAKSNIARGRAELPGVPAPGLQPGGAHGAVDNSRKIIFMLSPPSMPTHGVPPPAIEEQWRELGWKPAVEFVQPAEHTENHDDHGRASAGHSTV